MSTYSFANILPISLGGTELKPGRSERPPAGMTVIEENSADPSCASRVAELSTPVCPAVAVVKIGNEPNEPAIMGETQA